MAKTAPGQKTRRRMAEHKTTPPRIGKRPVQLPVSDRKQRVGNAVILVDDGLATGATMRASTRSVKAAAPKRLIVAVPVGATDACRAIAAEGDELICLAMPEPFLAVGAHFLHFEPVADEQVEAILRERPA